MNASYVSMKKKKFRESRTKTDSVLLFAGELWVVILKGPFEVVVGLLYGALVGALCWVLPESSHKVAHVLRLAMVVFAGLFALFGSQMVRRMYCNGLVSMLS